MTIINTAAAIGISVLIALGGGSEVTNTSETGHAESPRPEITRTLRGSKGEAVRVSGEAEHVYFNYSTVDMLAFMRMDAGDTSTAKFIVSMIDSDYMLADLDGFVLDSTFRVRNAGECKGIEGTIDWMPVYIMACADGRFVNLVMTTDKELGIDVMQDVYADGSFTVPEGYEEDAA